MSEQRRAPALDGELADAAEAEQPTNGSSADARVPSARPPAVEARQSPPVDSEESLDEESSELVQPSGKRARKRATAEEETTGAEDESRPAKEPKDGKKSRRPQSGRSRNPFAPIIKFFREVVSELSKVIWPQRRQMISYTAVVIVFVSVVVSFVAGLDIGFAKLTLWLLG